jgi:hypothetical protein
MSAPNKPHPITALPFVFDHAPKSRIDPRRSFWHVEPLGDYKEDCRTGSRYAIEYLRLVADDDRFDGGGYLAMIVDHMRAALAEKERSGIEVGFLQTIGFAARFGWRQAEQHHLDVEYHWQTEGTGALVNQRPDGSVVIEQPDGTRAVYRKVGCRMSADIVRLFPVTEPTRTIGELVDEADDVPARKLRQRMLAAAQAAGEFPSFQAKPGSPEYQAELRQLGDPGRPRHPLPLQDARCVRTTEHPDLGPNPCIRAALGNRGGLSDFFNPVCAMLRFDW